MTLPVLVYRGEALARYGFGEDHPFGADRHDAFHRRLATVGLDQRIRYCAPVDTDRATLETFHTSDYVQRVIDASAAGEGYLDGGDTPAVPGIYEAAATVVGSTIDAVDAVMSGTARRAFVPIAGLHHAARDSAAGFCVFNDLGVAIERLKGQYGLDRVLYVDIDAHHGDGVFYAFEDDAAVAFADIHEDGRYLYPGTGSADETGRGAGHGLKLNLPLPPGADDAAFAACWAAVEALTENVQPQFILMQCGADSMAGDPLTHLGLSEASHGMATASLCALADRYCEGRIVATGGGGYDRDNLARAWTRVVAELAA